MRYAAAAAMVILIIACGNGETDSSAAETSPEETVILSVTDTIGVLQGDENQMFGDIADVSCSIDGSVMVLDKLNTTISVFTHQGEFVKRIGGVGEAPWEFAWATSIAPMYDGTLLVSDYAGLRVVVFDDTLGYSHSVNGFTHTAPAGIQPLPDGTFIGRDSELWPDGDGSLAGENTVRRWSVDSPEPLSSYLSSPMNIRMIDDGLDVKPAAMAFAASPDGCIYCAVLSDSLFQVFGYDTEGNPTLEIGEPWERVAKTPEEMEAEGTATALSTDESGTRIPITIEIEVQPFHNAVKNLLCDDQGNLWVRMGSETVPTFRIYDPAGELLFIAECPDLEHSGRQIRFKIAHGFIMAWDTEPEDYPKVYIIEME